VICSKDRGGLGIREPEFMNLAMGAKLLWRFISGNQLGGKEPFKKNIFQEPDKDV
jgi:hypothetical protein